MSVDAQRPSGPVSTEHLVSVAKDLSREYGLKGWTMRTLEERAHVSPSSIYHRVGSQDRLIAQVVDSILRAIELPLDTVDWKDFFRITTERLFTELTPYPGTASWMMVEAPVLDGNLAFMHAGVARLSAAGIEPAGLAYSQISNTALGVIATAEQRSSTKRYATGEIMQRLEENFPATGPRETAAVRSLVAAFDHDDLGTLQDARRDYFRAAVDVAIAGVEAYRTGAVRGVERFTAAE